MAEDSEREHIALNSALSAGGSLREQESAALSLGVAEIASGRARVTLRGELDLAAAEAFKQVVQAEIDAGHEVLLDVAGVEFIDSTGLAAIISVWSAARSAGLGFALRDQLSPQVHRLFEMTEMLRTLPFEAAA